MEEHHFTLNGMPFYGWARTETGHLWWWVDENGRRHALVPVHAITSKPANLEAAMIEMDI